MRKILSLGFLCLLVLSLNACKQNEEDKIEDFEDETLLIEDLYEPNIKEDSVVKVKGKVMAINERGYILADTSGAIFVYSYDGDQKAYAVNDVVFLEGKKKVQDKFCVIVPETSKLSQDVDAKENFQTFNKETLKNYEEEPIYKALPIEFKGILQMIPNADKAFYNTNVLAKEGHYNLSFLEKSIEDKLLLETGNEVTMQGYLIGYRQKHYKIVLKNLIDTDPEEVKPVTEELKEAFKKDNYTYDFKATSGTYGKTKTVINKVNKGNYGRYEVDIDNYNALVNYQGEKRFYFNYKGFNYYALEGEKQYEPATWFQALDLRRANLNWFYQSGEVYKAYKNSLGDVGKFFTGYLFKDFKFNSFEMTIEDNKIKKVKASNIDSGLDEEVMNVTSYEFNFYDYDKTKVLIPDAKHYTDKTPEEEHSTEEDVLIKTSIKDLKELSYNVLVEVEGKITAITEEGFYITDGRDSVLVVMVPGALEFEAIKLYNNVKLKCFTSLKNKCRCLNSLMEADVISEDYQVSNENLEDLSQANLNLNIHNLMNLKEVMITSIDETNNDLTLILNNTRCHLKMTKDLSEELKSQLLNLPLNELVTLENIIVSHSDDFYLTFSNVSLIK